MKDQKRKGSAGASDSLEAGEASRRREPSTTRESILREARKEVVCRRVGHTLRDVMEDGDLSKLMDPGDGAEIDLSRYHDAQLLADLTGMNTEVAMEIMEAGGLHAFRDRILTLPPGIRTRTEKLLEFTIRAARLRAPQRMALKHSAAVADYLTLKYFRMGQEVTGALYLDCYSGLMLDKELYRGTSTRSVVEPREFLKVGLMIGASTFVVFHTHPYGQPAPSAEDLVFTRRLREAGEAVGVRLADFLILGSLGRWVSLSCRSGWE